MKKILIIVPAYNEAENIANVIDELTSIKAHFSHQIDILVVNDGSEDNTAYVVKSKDCILLDLPINLGIGGAMQTGFKYAFNSDYDIAIQVDGDGQHPTNEIVSLIQPILNNEFDVVIGSRFIEKQGYQSTPIRRIGINYFKWLNKIFTGTLINDTTSGFRALNKKAIALCNNYYPDEYPEPESIVCYSLNNLRIKEIPVLMKKRTAGVSSINSIQSLYYMFKVTLGIIFVYLRSNFSKK